MHSERNRACVSNPAAKRFASDIASLDGLPNHCDPSAVWKHPEPHGIADPVNTEFNTLDFESVRISPHPLEA